MKKLVFITADSSEFPEVGEMGNWYSMPQNEEYFVMEMDKYILIARECMEESYAFDTRTEIKHNLFASWLNVAEKYCKENKHDIDYDDIYVICHDKDLLDLSKEKGASRLLGNKETIGALQNKINDGNIYIFQHSSLHDKMYRALIMYLSKAEEDMVNNAILLIKSNQS